MIEIPEFLSVGPFILPAQMLLLLSLGLGMLFLVRWTCTKLDVPYNEWRDIWTNGVITYLIIWKFSSILYDPFSMLQQPVQLLYANGGALGQGLGILGAIGFILYSIKKRKISVYSYFDLFTIWLISTLTLFWIIQRTYGLPTSMPWGVTIDESNLSYHPTFLYHFLLGSSLLLHIFQLRKKFGTGIITFQTLFLLGTGLLLISLFVYQPSSLLLGLSNKQWLYLGMSVIGLIGSFPKNDRTTKRRGQGRLTRRGTLDHSPLQ